MNYTLNQLNIFLRVVKTLSITKAAEELHLTQPAVSIQLKNFQDQFNIPLTEVVGRKIYITDFGLEIAEVAQEIVNQVNTINFKTLAYQGQLIGQLRIAVVSTGKYVLPYFLSSFINDKPGIALKMDVTNKSSVVQSLENNEVDFALVSILPTTLNIEKIDLLHNKLLLVGKNKPIVKNPEDLNDIFKDLPLIFREKGSGTREVMEGFIKRNSITVLKKLELTSNEAVKQAILAGLGYSIMPLIGIRNEILNGDLHIQKLKGLPITTMWSLVWLKGKKLSPVARAYLHFLEKEKEAIVAEKFKWSEKY
jgi:DNA-binding transcriptional LysR family regulator